MSLSKPKQCSLSHLSLSLKPFEEMEHVEVLSRGTSLFIPAPEVRAACLSQCHPSRPPLPARWPLSFCRGAGVSAHSQSGTATEGDGRPNLFLEWRTLK